MPSRPPLTCDRHVVTAQHSIKPPIWHDRIVADRGRPTEVAGHGSSRSVARPGRTPSGSSAWLSLPREDPPRLPPDEVSARIDRVVVLCDVQWPGVEEADLGAVEIG